MPAQQTPADKVKGPASYFPCIEKKQGRSCAEWTDIIRAQGDRKHRELVSWVKADRGKGHGRANALVAHTLAGAARR